MVKHAPETVAASEIIHASSLCLSCTFSNPSNVKRLFQLITHIGSDIFSLLLNFLQNVKASVSRLVYSIQVFVYGVVFCSHCQLQETAKISSGINQQQQQQLYEPRCLPLPLLRLLTTDRQREWWDAIYSLIHKRAA